MESDLQALMCLEPIQIVIDTGKDETFLNNDRVLKTLLTLDEKNSRTQSYFDYQRELRPHMRRILTNWMLEVCEEQECHENVIVTAINYVDRVLTLHIPVKRSQLQLLAAACMFIASKFQDSTPLSARHLVMYTDYSITINDLLECELTVVQALKWELSFPGPYDFLDQILFRITSLTESSRSSLRRHASTLIIMCILEEKFLLCPPSLISAACVCAAGAGLMGEQWCTKVKLHRTVRKITSVDKETLRHHQELIEALLAENLADGRARSNSFDVSSSHRQNSNEEDSSKSSIQAQRLPSTPTDVLDIQLVS